MNSDKVFYILVTAFTVLIFGGILFFATKPSSSNSGTTLNVSNEEYPVDELVGSSPNTSADVKKALVVIVEFGDFQCPACKTYWADLVGIKEQFGDKVAVVYRQFPLTSIHSYAFDAAVASEAAAKQGKFFEYHDALFKNQTDDTNPLKKEDYISFAKDLGLNVEQFEKDLADDATKTEVREDMEYGNTVRVNSTPTFFIDGKRFEGGNLKEEINRIISSKSGE